MDGIWNCSDTIHSKDMAIVRTGTFVLKEERFREGEEVRIIRRCSGCMTDEICVLHYGSKNGKEMEKLFAWGKGGECGEGNCSCVYNWSRIERKGIKMTQFDIARHFQRRVES